jgi:hypothetical protein
MRSPSQILEDLAALVGWDAVATMVRMAGGQSRKIPLRASDEHWLTTFLGREKADALCKTYGGDTLWIPKNDGGVRELRDSQIRAMRRGPATRAATDQRAGDRVPAHRPPDLQHPRLPAQITEEG